MSQPDPLYPTPRGSTVIPRCWNCGRRLAEYVTEPWSIKCHTCGARTAGGQRPEDRSFRSSTGTNVGDPTRGRGRS